MRDVTEILNRLDDLEQEIDYAAKWVDAASRKYQKEISFWGKKEADDGEYRTAVDAHSTLLKERNVLLWVLNKEEVPAQT